MGKSEMKKLHQKGIMIDWFKILKKMKEKEITN